MNPPFKITNRILSLAAEIARFLGQYEGINSPVPEPKLRRLNQLRTIQGSLAIEGNTLDLNQVTAILEGRRVIGDRREILEIRNAIDAYARKWNPLSKADLLKAHGVLMSGLVPDAGKFRSTNVGIIKNSKMSHVAPKPNFVPKLMSDLFHFLKSDRSISPVIKACLFHYELEFIHPFADGNGRIGRLWQHVILLSESPIFAFIPVESIIKDRQEAYYIALSDSDKAGEATAFIEFSLSTIRDGLAELMEQTRAKPITTDGRLDIALSTFGSKVFTRKDYLNRFKSISTSTASRDLAAGVKSRKLKKTGDKAQAHYRFITG